MKVNWNKPHKWGQIVAFLATTLFLSAIGSCSCTQEDWILNVPHKPTDSIPSPEVVIPPKDSVGEPVSTEPNNYTGVVRRDSVGKPVFTEPNNYTGVVRRDSVGKPVFTEPNNYTGIVPEEKPTPTPPTPPVTPTDPIEEPKTSVGDPVFTNPKPKALKTPIEAKNIPLHSWMREMPDNTKLFSLLLPGSHDSGTYTLGRKLDIPFARIVYAVAQTQSISIHEQLLHGVRALDIRLYNDVGRDDLYVYHGIVSCDITFSDVMYDVRYFLEKNPYETVVMVIKDENQNADNLIGWRVKMGKELQKYKDLFVETVNNLTTLGEVRGKVVLLTRTAVADNQLGYGIQGWGDNTMGECVGLPYKPNNGGFNMYYQDMYAPTGGATKKVQVALQTLEVSREKFSKQGAWTFNYLSYTQGASYPRDLAGLVNAPLVNYFRRMNIDPKQAVSYCGIVFMDFVGTNFNGINGEALVEELKQHNFLKPH